MPPAQPPPPPPRLRVRNSPSRSCGHISSGLASWDLATASGTTIEVNDAVIATSQEALEREVPVEGRAELWARSRADLPEDFPWSDPFGAVPPLSGEISALDRLVATSGRDPRWTADQPSASATA